MELTAYLRAFKRQWLVIAVVTVLCLAGAFAVTRALPKTYDADAVLFVKVNSSADSLFEQSQFSTQRVKSYPDLIYSPEILNTVSDELGLGLTPGQLGSKIKAVNPVDTVFVKITAEGATPAQAAGTANLVAEKLAEQIRILETNQGDTVSAVEPRVTVPAVEPGTAVFPNNTVNMALGGLIGLSLGLIGAIVLDRRDTRVRTEEDVLEATGLEVLGKVQRTMKKAAHADTPDSHDFRDLTTRMLLHTQNHLPGILLMTPASAELQTRDFRKKYAEYLTNTGRRVCVLEADAASEPTFAEIPATPGFVDVLAENATMAEVVQQVGPGSLSAVATGGEGVAVSQFDVARRAGTAVKELAEGFDILITQTRYESRPLNTATIAPVAGGAVLLCDYGKTPSADLGRAALELKVHGVNLIGVVMLNAPRAHHVLALGRSAAAGTVRR